MLNHFHSQMTKFSGDFWAVSFQLLFEWCLTRLLEQWHSLTFLNPLIFVCLFLWLLISQSINKIFDSCFTYFPFSAKLLGPCSHPEHTFKSWCQMKTFTFSQIIFMMWNFHDNFKDAYPFSLLGQLVVWE